MAYLFSFYSVLYFPTTLLAPNLPKEFYIEEPQCINIWEKYEPLVDAVRTVESQKNDSAYNKKEKATGSFQIRPCRLNHYNTLTGSNYTLNDMFDYNIARKVFLYFATHDNKGRLILNKSFELVAKNWNGSGPKTEIYWDNIQAILKRNNT